MTRNTYKVRLRHAGGAKSTRIVDADSATHATDIARSLHGDVSVIDVTIRCDHPTSRGTCGRFSHDTRCAFHATD